MQGVKRCINKECIKIAYTKRGFSASILITTDQTFNESHQSIDHPYVRTCHRFVLSYGCIPLKRAFVSDQTSSRAVRSHHQKRNVNTLPIGRRALGGSKLVSLPHRVPRSSIKERTIKYPHCLPVPVEKGVKTRFALLARLKS